MTNVQKCENCWHFARKYFFDRDCCTVDEDDDEGTLHYLNKDHLHKKHESNNNQFYLGMQDILTGISLVAFKNICILFFFFYI